MIYNNKKINAALFNVEDFQELPTCGVEDLDQAVYELFSEKLPFFYRNNNTQVRMPAIFASGERAVMLKKRRALRDNTGALILPVISVLRTGLEQDPEGFGLTPVQQEILIKKKIYKNNSEYKREKNLEGLDNADYTVKELVKDGHFSRRDYNLGDQFPSIRNNSQNIYEYYTIPVPRFFKCTYEITFWCQFQKQLNSALEALLDFYNTPARSFMLESEKGYKFTANIDGQINQDNNVDNLTDAERIVKASINLTSYGYIINPDYPGSISSVKRYVTQPKIVFETNIGTVPQILKTNGLSSNDPNNYIEDDWAHEFANLPGSSLGYTNIDQENEADVTIGNTNKTVTDRYVLETKDPVTGKSITEKYIIKDVNHRKGEIVLRQIRVL